MTKALVLVLPDHAKLYDAETNTLDFVIGDLLMTDNVAELLHNLKEVESEQARSQDFLAQFDYVLEYKSEEGKLCGRCTKSKDGVDYHELIGVLMNRVDQGRAPTWSDHEGPSWVCLGGQELAILV
ncbi:uncharacterized protein J3R85_015355 [Psidium guajava]|nr:uncharacterized protein J3R85_015355 [Psidium guajava]